MELVARSVTEFVTRLLADEDRGAGEGAARPVAIALGAASDGLYQQGAVAASGMPKYEAYVIRNIGHFPDVSSSLIQSHLDKSDQARRKGRVGRLEGSV